MRRELVLVVIAVCGAVYSAPIDDYQLLLDELLEAKTEAEAVKKAIHDEIEDEISAKIESNIHELGNKIKAITSEFNTSNPLSVLGKIKTTITENIKNNVGKLKELKDEVKQRQKELWEQNSQKLSDLIVDIATVVEVAKADATNTVVDTQAKDLAASLSRINGTSSWRTISWLLIALTLLLVGLLAIILIKEMGLSRTAYQRLDGNSQPPNQGDVFVPSQYRP